MSERDFIAANMPAGAEILEACESHVSVWFQKQYMVTAYADRTTVSGHIPIAAIGSSEWTLLQSALDFAQSIEQRREEQQNAE